MQSKISSLMKLSFLIVFLIAGLFQKVHSAVYVVDNSTNPDNGLAYTLGDGTNTLRKCIRLANANAGADIINFNFGANTTIALTSCLPQIISPITIDGYSNPGSGAGNLMIEVTASSCSGVFELAVGSDGSTIRGLVISGASIGIRIQNSSNHSIKGNYIGTNRAGTALATSRVQDGINLSFSNNTIIGGIGGQIDRNIISGATQDGIRVVASIGVAIINNFIGTDVTGNIGLGNNGNGIDGYNNGATGSNNIKIGGATPAERNVISDNRSNGIYLNFCQSPVIKGNIVGMGLNGTSKLGNYASGIDVQNTGTAATRAQIGGPTTDERNYSSCNAAFGVVVRSAPGSIIENNWLGVDMATGNLDYGNNDAAITVTNTADVQCLNNICSGSGNPGFGADGISIWSNSPRPIIKGNIIGLGADGTTALQNYGHGIECLTCDDGIIGGLLASERNLIANSFNIGIQCVNSPRVNILNNYIGTDVTGTLDRGGSQMGINVGGTSSDVIIGGSLAASNIIAYNNGSAGIVLEGSVQRVLMTYNSIFCNNGLGIDLTSTANESVLPPVIVTTTANSVSGTCAPGNTVHVYRNIKADGGIKCNCEGEIYLGEATVTGGTWTLIHNLGLTAAQAGPISATQTTPNKSTSEFSNCSIPLPVELISFWVVKNSEDKVIISWSTASEKNNNRFEVQRSIDGINFQTIQIIEGSENSTTILNYSTLDNDPLEGINYYRLLQVDNDGQSFISTMKSVEFLTTELYIVPDNDGFTLVVGTYEGKKIDYLIYSITGAMILEGEAFIPSGSNRTQIKLNLARAVYIASIFTESAFITTKINLLE